MPRKYTINRPSYMFYLTILSRFRNSFDCYLFCLGDLKIIHKLYGLNWFLLKLMHKI